ncbi:MAG: hypothetical protein J6Y33_06305, partial [Prevotella sp.]|nr:hypothetical protein [Prevotella sp.]
IAGLGTFYLTAECTKGGADKEEDFNVNQHLKALHIRFLPDQTEEDNLSSREFIKKAEFVNVKSLLSSGNTEGGTGTGSNGGSGSNTGEGSQSGSEGGNTQNGSQNQATGFALTINKSGTGSASVTHNGNAVTSGATLNEDDEVEISITPAEGKVPTASVNGSSIELTEDGGVYTGSFAMPGQASTLSIDSGTAAGDGGDGLTND